MTKYEGKVIEVSDEQEIGFRKPVLRSVHIQCADGPSIAMPDPANQLELGDRVDVRITMKRSKQ